MYSTEEAHRQYGREYAVQICNAGITLTGYHPPGLTSRLLIFFVKIPAPGTASQCKTLAPGVEKTK